MNLFVYYKYIIKAQEALLQPPQSIIYEFVDEDTIHKLNALYPSLGRLMKQYDLTT